MILTSTIVPGGPNAMAENLVALVGSEGSTAVVRPCNKNCPTRLKVYSPQPLKVPSAPSSERKCGSPLHAAKKQKQNELVNVRMHKSWIHATII